MSTRFGQSLVLSLLRCQELFDSRILVQDIDFLLVNLVVLLERVRAKVLHLLVDVDEGYALADVLLDLNQEVPVDVHELLHVLRVFAGALRAVGFVLDSPLHRLLVFSEFLLDV